jgi:LDH2 family malate/lactate/ureidoglycolate dehydrogenase
MPDHRFRPEALTSLGTRIFMALGAPEDIAGIIAGSLVDANLTGHDSHGVLRIPQYVERIRDGRVRPAARPRVIEGRGATGMVSGEWGFGQLAGRLGLDEAVRRARESGVGAVGVVRCNHLGRMGEYMERAAEQGCVGLVWVGGLGRRAAVPHGGRQPTLGTNPIAVGFPVEGEHPVVVDFATTAVAAGKIMVARAAHRPLAPGCIVDKEGRPTTDVEDYYAGGALLPAAAHKGFGLSVAAELLGQALTGAETIDDAPGKEPVHNHSGALFIALDPGVMRPAEDTRRQARRIVDRIRAVPPAEGFDRVRTPGQPEVESRAARSAGGIELPEDAWRAIKECALGAGLRSEDLPASS